MSQTVTLEEGLGPVRQGSTSVIAPGVARGLMRRRRARHPNIGMPFGWNWTSIQVKPPSRSMAVGLRVSEVRVDRPQFVHEQLERSGIAFK
jgi:hypothetical protein